MVTEKDAVEILSCAEGNGIPVWLDGGWGVDALLGEETRVARGAIKRGSRTSSICFPAAPE